MPKLLVVFAAVMGLAASVSAQAGPVSPAAQGSAASNSRAGGLAGLLGGAIPNVASVGAGNAAGLLGYCLKNNLLGATAGSGAVAGTPAGTTTAPAGAQSVLDRLIGRQGVASSPGFLAGQAGRVQTGAGSALPLDALKGQVKTRVCSAVLKRATSFL